MPREASLFEDAGGSALEGYFLLKKSNANVPEMWIERASESRRSRHDEVARVLKEGSWADIAVLREFEEAYQKECFYYGIRLLLDLERKGKTDY
jgi:hypothetical protein